MANVSAWMVQQMLALADMAESTQPPRFNPRPQGVIRSGSATHAVYELFHAHKDQCFNHGQIVRATKRSAKSVDWGLLFLRQCNLIECLPDPRNTRYWVYRLRKSPDPTLRWKR